MSGASQLTLFVTGDAPRSRRARKNLAAALEAAGDAAPPVAEIDLVAQPETAVAYGIFATPALLRHDRADAPAVMYGDLSDRSQLAAFLAAPAS